MCLRAAVCVLTIYACRYEYYYILYMCPHNVLNKCLDTATTLLLLQVHGNTLTAAAVLQKIPSSTKRAFVLGATSKLGIVPLSY
jgi:hypothetical protein